MSPTREARGKTTEPIAGSFLKGKYMPTSMNTETLRTKIQEHNAASNKMARFLATLTSKLIGEETTPDSLVVAILAAYTDPVQDFDESDRFTIGEALPEIIWEICEFEFATEAIEILKR